MIWLNNKINVLKKIGFFENESNQDLIHRILEESKTHYYGQIFKLEKHPDLLCVLSSYDKKKTWFTENESDPSENTWVIQSDLELTGKWTLKLKIDYYYEVFKQLEKISNGRFIPNELNIDKCGECEGIAERLNVNFFLNGKKRNLNFCIDYPKLLLSFLVELNEIIADTGYSFIHYIEKNYISFFVYFFNNEQREIFNSLIDYKYYYHEDYTNYWLFKAQYNVQQKYNDIAYSCFQKAISCKYNIYTINAINSFATFLSDLGELEEAKNLYKQGLSILRSNKSNSNSNDSWIMIFEMSLKNKCN